MFSLGIVKPPSGLVKPGSYSSTGMVARKQADNTAIVESTSTSNNATPSAEETSKSFFISRKEQSSIIGHSKIEQVSKITPPKIEKRLTPPSSKIEAPQIMPARSSPATARKIPLPSGQTRRASDGTLGLQTKSRLEVAGSLKPQQKVKKLSDLSRNESIIHESGAFRTVKAKSEIEGLKYPIVGGSMIHPPRYNNKTSSPNPTNPAGAVLNQSRILKFQPNPIISSHNPAANSESESESGSTTAKSDIVGDETSADVYSDVTPTNERTDISPNENMSDNDILPNGCIENVAASEPEQASGEIKTTIEQTEDEEKENEDVKRSKNNCCSLLSEKDPFSEFESNDFDTSKLTGINDFDTSKLTGINDFDTSKLTGINEFDTSKLTGIDNLNTSQGLRKISSDRYNTAEVEEYQKYESGDSDIDSDNPKSVCDESDSRPKLLDDAARDESMKRSEQLSSDSGYIEPLENLSVSRTSIANSTGGHRKYSLNNHDDASCYSSSESNSSPRFGEQEQSRFQDPTNRNTVSPFKRVQPKIIVPPPRLNSYTDDLLAPLPKDYMRTPSSDMEESSFGQQHQSQADVELRRKVREKAIKVWGKTPKKKDSAEEIDDVQEEEHGDGDALNDVFYTKNMEHKSSKSTLINFFQERQRVCKGKQKPYGTNTVAFLGSQKLKSNLHT